MNPAALGTHDCLAGGQAVLAGQAVAGLAVASASFGTVWAATPGRGVSPHRVSAPAVLYFAIAMAVMAVCAAAYVALWSVPYARRRWEAGALPPHDWAYYSSVGPGGRGGGADTQGLTDLISVACGRCKQRFMEWVRQRKRMMTFQLR